MREYRPFVFCGIFLVLFASVRGRTRGLGLEPGPAVLATQGSPWPAPQSQLFFDSFYMLDTRNFTFSVQGETCDILEYAIARYQIVLAQMRRAFWKTLKRTRLGQTTTSKKYSKDDNFVGDLLSLDIRLSSPCEDRPYLYMDEQYQLKVNAPDAPGEASLNSQSIWGILRGLETFVQLLYPLPDTVKLAANSTSILDYPRFSYRGLHMDTARHFMPIRVILNMLDAMAMNKFNVFHWHIVDDQSFPFVSAMWPSLSEKGAYSAAHVYSPGDVATVIDAARMRGIRVIPEFDTPGHTRSWGNAYPEILAECYDNQGELDGTLGPMNPLNNFTYTLMNGLLQEVATVFPDTYIHIGGDEVPHECWESNPEISQYMTEKNITAQQLEGQYVLEIVKDTISIGKNRIVWEEVFTNGVNVPKSTVIHVWKDWVDWRATMDNVTRSGYPALFSSCWYLDHLTSGGDWHKFYQCDPALFLNTPEQRALVMGGEACMWAEVVDATNIMTRVWPRASAAAERLWSSAYENNLRKAEKRLEEHSCRMNLRGIPSQPPNGPGFCPYQLFA